MKLSQLRQDLVSGDWIVIAPKRAERPHEFESKGTRKRAPIKGCPFEDPKKYDHAELFLEYRNKRGWTLEIVENRFPAFVHKNICSVIRRIGPNAVTDGIGHHDVVITRDHDADFPDLDSERAIEVFKAFQERYLMLLHDDCLAYISIFHNWGPAAGASIYHPHYQLIAIPVVPPDVEHSLQGSRRHFEKYKQCVHCTVIEWERREKKRIIFENKEAVAFMPFASRNSFEFGVFPKRHQPFFENSSEFILSDVSLALHGALKMMKKKLKDPDYNFYIHTAPVRKKETHRHYHWHIEVLPKLNISAGFELGTGIDINPVDPDEAAKILRGRKE